VAFFGLLVSFPFEILALGTLCYLAVIPLGVTRYRQMERAGGSSAESLTEPTASPPPTSAA
jgi:CDP-diacylglycerol---serine O-phosphatidyltransferase